MGTITERNTRTFFIAHLLCLPVRVTFTSRPAAHSDASGTKPAPIQPDTARRLLEKDSRAQLTSCQVPCIRHETLHDPAIRSEHRTGSSRQGSTFAIERDKNSPWNGPNIQKGELYVKKKNRSASASRGVVGYFHVRSFGHLYIILIS